MSEDPILSICIPTYNNALGVKKNLEHLLTGIDINRYEIIIGDDASDEEIKDLVSEYQDDPVIFFENNNNLGPVRNMIKTYKHANGKYVLFQSDEDKLDIPNLHWLIKKLEQEDDLNVVIGRNGGSRWNGQFPMLSKIVDSEEAMIQFGKYFNENPYSWSKSYGGGFVLRKSALKLDHLEDRIKEYPIPHYTINIPILEATSNGGLLFIDRTINYKQYWNNIGVDSEKGNRTWRRIGNKSSLDVIVKSYNQRLKYIYQDISSDRVRSEFLKVELLWLAQVTAWAIISPTVDYTDVKSQFVKSHQEHGNAELYSSLYFWLKTIQYVFSYFTPIYTPQMNNDLEVGKYPKDRALAVWWFCVGERILPNQVAQVIGELGKRYNNLFSISFWRNKAKKYIQ